jgi:hypothetical protein
MSVTMELGCAARNIIKTKHNRMIFFHTLAFMAEVSTFMIVLELRLNHVC